MPAINPPLKVTREKLVEELWRRGELSFLLYPYQLPVYNAIKHAQKTGALKCVTNCSRRFGKSTILIIIALEEAIKNKRHQIRFAAPTAKDLKKALYPIMMEMTKSCPEDLLPKFNSQDNSFKFTNGSGIHLAGVNGLQADNLRGSVSHLNIVDEAGSIDELRYLIQSVLIPQTLTTGGLTVIASTPSLSPDHEYYHYYQEAEASSNLSEFTIYDNKSLSPEKIEQIKIDNGGDKNTTWRREYLVEFCVDSELNIIPEWQDKYINEHEHDEFYHMYDHYLAMDLGVIDFTACLYATYNFREGKLYIEKEDTISGNEMTTKVIYDTITNSEKSLWKNQKIYKRVADNNNPLLLQDLSRMHGMFIRSTTKDSLDAMVNEVRMFIQQGRLVIDPSCTMTLGCLRHGIWKKNKSNREFARSSTYKHYDHLAALVYLIRNLDQQHNPIPAHFNVDSSQTWINKQSKHEDFKEALDALKRAFKIG